MDGRGPAGAQGRPAVKWLMSVPMQWLIALALGGAFLYAAYPKIREPREFARIVYHYRMLGPNQTIPPAVANSFAVTLPWIEALTGLLLIVGIWRREAALLSAALLVVFIVAVGVALARGIDIENCGCFTVHGEGRRAGLGLILGDTAMLVGALLLVRAPSSARQS